MIALDTNVLMRLMVQDDEAQARVAERFVARARRERTPMFIADVVLCEFVWMLMRRLGLSRGECASKKETFPSS